MSLTTYSELQTAVASWLHRSDLTAILPDLITVGEKKIFREVRARVMESTLTGTISSGVVALPSDYLGVKFARLTTTPAQNLTWASASQIYAQYPLRSSDRKPVLIGREGTNFIFGPYPDSAYTLAGIYYAQPTVIASSANALFLANPDLYLFAALSEAGDYTANDKNVVKWTAKYEAIRDSLNQESRLEAGSGGGMQVRPA